MKIVLIISSLAAGGAERVMSIIANYWARKGWDIILLTFDDGSEPPFYNLDPKINHQPLNLAGKSHNILEGIWNNFHRVRVIRKAIKKYSPQAVVAFMIRTNILTLIALLGLKIPSIVCEHSHPNFYCQDKIWPLLRNLIYPKASQLTVLTHAVLSCLPPRVRRKAVVIPNPVK
ncbi:MAG: glycosyltransferase, partial [Nitrospinaceae bacterium]